MKRLSYVACVGLITGLLPTITSAELPSGIHWYGILDDGLAAARQLERPILLVSAAPQCAGISGMW